MSFRFNLVLASVVIIVVAAVFLVLLQQWRLAGAARSTPTQTSRPSPPLATDSVNY